MLFPFDRNLLYAPNVNGRYIPTILNDTLRFEQIPGGLLVCVGTDRTGYVLFKNNKPVFMIAYMHECGPDMLRNVPFYTIADQNGLDVYVNLIDEPATVEHLYAFFNMPVSYAAPYELADIERTLGFIEAEKISGVMGFRQGSVLNTAVFNEGEFIYLSYYHPGTKSYAFDKNRRSLQSYIKNADKLKPYIVFKKVRNEFQSKSDKKEMILLQSDPIVNTMLCYIDIFDIIYKILNENAGREKADHISRSVFGLLKEKYSPLFSSLSYSPESGSVNWNQMFDERRYVSIEYRFGHYHLYLDELLKLLFKGSFSVLNEEAISFLVPRVRNYIAMMDRKDRDLKDMVCRIEKILNKLTDK